MGRIAKDYMKIAKAKITSPSQSARPPRILVYARNKKGKTRFGLTAGARDEVLVLDPEHGTDEYKRADPHTWHIERWQDMDDAYGFLRLGKHKYKWVLVDGLTRINNYALHFVRRTQEKRNLDRQPGMIDRRDYFKSGELMKLMLANFHGLPNMGVIYTAQEKILGTADDGDDDDAGIMYVPDLPASVRGAVNSLVDVIGRLSVVKVNVKMKGAPKGKTEERIMRQLFIGNHEMYDTGARSDYVIPDRLLDPNVPDLVKLMRTGKLKKAS